MEQRQYGEMTTLETRHDSHQSVDKKKRYSQIIEVLKYALKDGWDGLSAKDCAVRMYLKGYIPTTERNFTAPRLTEMAQEGIVEPIGKDICQFTGKKVTIWGLTEIGRK